MQHNAELPCTGAVTHHLFHCSREYFDMHSIFAEDDAYIYSIYIYIYSIYIYVCVSVYVTLLNFIHENMNIGLKKKVNDVINSQVKK